MQAICTTSKQKSQTATCSYKSIVKQVGLKLSLTQEHTDVWLKELLPKFVPGAFRYFPLQT